MAKQIVVDTMTFDEILDLFRLDIPLVNHRIEDADKVFRKKATLLRNVERIYYKPIEFSSARGFSYVIQFFNRGIKYERRKRIGVYYYVQYLHKGGVYTFMLSTANKELPHLVVFTPHFVNRYRERLLKDLTISKNEAIATFIRGNAKRALRFEPSLKYPDCSYSHSADGLSLCELRPNMTIIYKTFIPWDDLGPNKKQLAIENMDGLKEIIQSGFELNLPDEIFNDI